jgi:NAD(P)-dependent dehydrogenase (short-subunit alcohol dehydrogenase family)
MPKAHILLVGGTRGLGRHLSELLRTRDVITTVLARQSYLGSAPSQIVQCDITVPEQLLDAMEKVKGLGGRLDGVVFCQRYRSGNDNWSGEIATTLTASRMLIDFVSEDLNDNASLVFVSSVNSNFVSPAVPVSYHVAKAGLVQIARYYACTLGHRGIRANVVSPGTFVKPETKAFYESDNPKAEILRKKTALKRLGTSLDVCNAILFLLGVDSGFITGQEIVVDGGASLFLNESM